MSISYTFVLFMEEKELYPKIMDQSTGVLLEMISVKMLDQFWKKQIPYHLLKSYILMDQNKSENSLNCMYEA